jgi:hypothetical protein
MAQVSNVQSRTIRINGSLPESVKTTLSTMKDVVLLQKDGEEGRSKCFVTAEEVTSVIELLSTNNVAFRPHFYSLFAKFNQELKKDEVDKLNAKITEIAPNSEISYSRIDENGHTGKVVLDRFDDYNALRAHTGEFTFYKFNRTKAQSRMGGSRKPSEGAAQGGARPVRSQKPSYASAVAPDAAAPATEAGWETQGKRQSRGRGGARTAAPRAPRAPRATGASKPAPASSS